MGQGIVLIGQRQGQGTKAEEDRGTENLGCLKERKRELIFKEVLLTTFFSRHFFLIYVSFSNAKISSAAVFAAAV